MVIGFRHHAVRLAWGLLLGKYRGTLRRGERVPGASGLVLPACEVSLMHILERVELRGRRAIAGWSDGEVLHHARGSAAGDVRGGCVSALSIRCRRVTVEAVQAISRVHRGRLRTTVGHRNRRKRVDTYIGPVPGVPHRAVLDHDGPVHKPCAVRILVLRFDHRAAVDNPGAAVSVGQPAPYVRRVVHLNVGMDPLAATHICIVLPGLVAAVIEKLGELGQEPRRAGWLQWRTGGLLRGGS